MKTIPTVKGCSYTVASDDSCDVVDVSTGKKLGTASAGSPLSFIAQGDSTSLSVDSATYTVNRPPVTGAGGVSESDLVELGVLAEKTEMRECEFLGWQVDAFAVKTAKKLEFDLVKPISGTVYAIILRVRGASFMSNVRFDHGDGANVFNNVSSIPVGSFETPNGKFYECKIFLPEIITVDRLHLVTIEFSTAIEFLQAKNAASEIENGIYYKSDERGDCDTMVEPPAMSLLGERAVKVLGAVSGSRCTIQARVMTEEEGYLTESRNSWRLLDPLTVEDNVKSEAEYAANGRTWAFRRLYYYDESSAAWWHCGWEIVIPADAREIVEWAFTEYAATLADVSEGLYSVDIRIFNHD